MDAFPLVSAIVPVYNGERYLAEALDSVVHRSTMRLSSSLSAPLIQAVHSGGGKRSPNALATRAVMDFTILKWRFSFVTFQKGTPPVAP